MRRVEIQCDCKNIISATVFKRINFDLTCSVCGRNFLLKVFVLPVREEELLSNEEIYVNTAMG
jgi:hypothetical protein